MLSILMFVSSCSYVRRAERAELANRAKTELVGMAKVDLLTCAGVPERSASEDGFEFFSYTSTSGRRSRSSCLVTFTLRDGVVQTLNYSGRTGRWSQNGERCVYAIQACLMTQAGD
jgi:hypothetical protein